MVIRQSRLHLADLETGTYPMQPILDFTLRCIGGTDPASVCEVGCSVGRLIGEIAQTYPTADCYGVDYSYQMLRQAQRYWLQGEAIDVKDEHLGYPPSMIPSRTPLTNLNLLMAKASDLPFGDHSMDVVITSFLLDRLDDPLAALGERRRVLRHGGRLMIATPLNWSSTNGWADLPDSEVLLAKLADIGLQVQSHQHILIKEPIDARGNYVGWETELIVADKV